MYHKSIPKYSPYVKRKLTVSPVTDTSYFLVCYCEKTTETEKSLFWLTAAEKQQEAGMEAGTKC